MLFPDGGIDIREGALAAYARHVNYSKAEKYCIPQQRFYMVDC